ncbi:Dual specificity protein phosphatase 1 [Pteropus alecto]|uniref:Dual specificity protein phosphatase 1 n=1 Tax=Pteropus alecto TaxID=9402 RepID=L5L187_PTEAL|nr:Dual specificity protein phosphatase 1 [Pteropus alecto]
MVLEVGSLDAGGLRALLRERAAQCLLLDCRSFFAFNAGHIAGSVNVRFSTIVRRRAKGAMGLEHIVPNAELRGRLLAGAYHAVLRAGRTPPSALPGARLALSPCPTWSAGAPESYSGDLSLALFVWLREQRLPGETSSPGGWGSCVEGALSQRY